MSELWAKVQNMPRFDPGPDRFKLGFVKAVLSSFRFLMVEQDFRVVQQEPTLVRFESARSVVNVFHGRGSFELGVEIGRGGQGTKEEVRYSLREVIGLSHEPDTVGYRHLQTSSAEALPRLVEQLAELTRRYASDALRGDWATFAQLEEQRARQSRALIDSYAAQRLRDKASEAWTTGDLEAVLEAYLELGKLDTVELTKSEAARLRYVQRKVKHS